MRKILLLLIATTLTIALTAQRESDRPAIEKATAELTAVYGLDEAQQSEMYTIQERRFRNLTEIEPLREQDYRLFLAKRKAVRTGTENSIERLLTESQREIFFARKVDRRKQEAALIKEMRAAGASKAEIQLKLLELGI